MRYKTIIFLIVILLSIGYINPLAARRGARRDNEPEWLTNPQSRYPEAMYIVAIGEGDSRGRAEVNAVSNLARIFETRVETEELFTERYEEIVSGNNIHAESILSRDSAISLSASQTLYNVQFADSYTNNLGRVFVLAYINRLQTANIYVDMISYHAEKVRFFTDRFDSAACPLQRYAYSSVASVVSNANQMLLEQLTLISPNHVGMVELGYNHNELLLETRNAAQSIAYVIDVEGDKDNNINSILREMLTGKGFVVTDDADMRITGNVEIEDVELPRPEKFVRWNMTLDVLDSQGNNIVTHSKRGREGHVNRSEAVARAFRAMERDIHEEFNKKLFRYFDNLVSAAE